MTDIAINREALVEYLATANFYVELSYYVLRHYSPTESERSDNAKKYEANFGARVTLRHMLESLLDKEEYRKVLVESGELGDKMFSEHMKERGITV